MTGTFCWIAEICYDGKRPCYAGSVAVRRGAPMAEVEQAVKEEIECHLPGGFEITGLQRGTFVYVRDGEDDGL